MKNSTELQTEFRDRQQSLLDTAIREYKAGSRPTEPGWSADLVLLAKANLTIPAEQIDALVQKTIKSTKADFYLAELTNWLQVNTTNK